MSRPVIVGLALREDDAAPIRLGLTLAGLSGAPIALVHALPREAPGRVPVPEYTAAIREAGAGQLRAAIAALPAGHRREQLPGRRIAIAWPPGGRRGAGRRGRRRRLDPSRDDRARARR